MTMDAALDLAGDTGLLARCDVDESNRRAPRFKMGV
jgi:hypothetical protein